MIEKTVSKKREARGVATFKSAQAFRFFAFCLACIAISGVALGAAESEIYGTWREVHSNMSDVTGSRHEKESIRMEFRRDGKLVFIEQGQKRLYRFEMEKRGVIRLFLTNGVLEKKVEFDGPNRMRMILERPKGPAQLEPIIDEYQRILPAAR